jgi:NAD(P)-dependent dehydrogenase (short-subunit alcohol dehydrogenase family)
MNRGVASTIALVAGVMSGIGRATGLGLARHGTVVVLAARDQATGRPAASTSVGSRANLSTQAEIRSVADEFIASMHGLIDSAVVFTTARALPGTCLPCAPVGHL